MVHIADSGFFIAILNRRDAFHDWARQLVARLEPPIVTCESALCEAAFVLNAADQVAQFVAAGDVVATPLNGYWERVHALLDQYGRQMDWTDACIVCLSEIHRGCRVITVDKKGFAIYRRFREQPIPLLTPD